MHRSLQISNHSMKSNARRSPTTPHSEREGIFSFNPNFFVLTKIGIGIWTDICKVFTISPDIETKFSALSSSILLSISCLKITHHLLTGNFQTDPEWGNTQGREAWVMMTIPGQIHPNYLLRRTFSEVIKMISERAEFPQLSENSLLNLARPAPGSRSRTRHSGLTRPGLAYTEVN